MSADTGVEIELTSDFIANNFVEQYYAAIHKDPELVRKFYGADSVMTHLEARMLPRQPWGAGTPIDPLPRAPQTSSKEEPIQGADLIHEKIVSLGLQGGAGLLHHHSRGRIFLNTIVT